MGYAVSNGQVGMDQQKPQAITDWPTPFLWQDVQCPRLEVPWDIISGGSLKKEAEPDENVLLAASVVHSVPIPGRYSSRYWPPTGRRQIGGHQLGVSTVLVAQVAP